MLRIHTKTGLWASNFDDLEPDALLGYSTEAHWAFDLRQGSEGRMSRVPREQQRKARAGFDAGYSGETRAHAHESPSRPGWDGDSQQVGFVDLNELTGGKDDSRLNKQVLRHRV